MLNIFGPLEPEWQEREKYCKFKAGIILKCLKSGEEPPRGNPFAKEEEKQEEDNTMNEASYDASTQMQMMGGSGNAG
jgi:hypothetical protein